MRTITPVLLVFTTILAACDADLARDPTGGASRGAAALSGAGAGPDRYQLVGIRQLTARGGRVDWSPDGQLIVFDRKNADGF